MATISASVGSGGTNKQADVLIVQTLLNQYLTAQEQPLLAAGGTIDADTILTIQAYQKDVVGLANPDGRIDPGGKTWKALASGQGFAPTLSGKAWWNANQGSYPNSNRLEDLAKPFGDNAARFVKALKDAGASVTISATLRHPIRAKLMRYCWDIAKGIIAPRDAPAIPGCAIRWDHGDLAASRAGAQEMVDCFAIAFQPAITSLHIEGRAIDMTIGWNGTLKIRDAAGKEQSLGLPRSGETNTDLHKIGAGYKLLKLLSDPPHWSETGH